MTDYVVHKKGEIVAERLKLRGGWVVAHIDQTFGWPIEDMIIEYEGRELILMTYDDERQLLPAVGILCQPGDAEAAGEVIDYILLECTELGVSWVGSNCDVDWRQPPIQVV